MIRILIAEDHSLVRAGIRALLENQSDIHIVGEAENGQEAVDLTRELKPDVLIMDIMMPRLNGIQAALHIQEEKLPVRILLLSMYSDAGFVHQALRYGVKGYLLKSSVSDELIAAIHAVAEGHLHLSASISDLVIESFAAPDPSLHMGNPLDALAPREREVLQLIAEEHTSSEIAQMLFISEKTVEKHRASLLEKLNVRNMAGLVRMALKYHLVEVDSAGGRRSGRVFPNGQEHGSS